MDQIKQTLFQFLDRQLSIKDFEQWVYATPALEQLIPPASYVELIALNYAHKFTYDRIEKLVMPLIDEGGYQLWKLQSRLRIFIDGFDIDNPDLTIELIEQIYLLYCDGYDFLGDFLEYEIILSSNLERLDQQRIEILQQVKQNLLRSFFPQIIHDASKALFWLEQGLIVPTGWANVQYGYEDYRHPSEKTYKF